MDRVIKASHIFFFFFLIGVVAFGLATPFLTVLFSYFALSHFKRIARVWLAIAFFLILVLGLTYSFFFLAKGAVANLPEIAAQSIPSLLEYAKKYHFQLPFTDIESFRAMVMNEVKHQLGHLAKFARIGLKESAFLVLGIIIAISLFLSRRIDLNEGKYPIVNNLYTLLCAEIAKRFQRFFESFSTIMEAQLIISTINTVCTTIFVLLLGLPYAKTIIVITFICGLFPIIGNLISNTIIFGVAVTKSLYLAILALVFLVGLHKFEYFLNSKIIGRRIKNPVWLTLLSLIVGEKTMGIPGMILAPIILHYLKLEFTQIEVKPSQN